MRFVLIIFHLLVTLVLIGVILLQKGEEGGAAGGGQNSMFSARGAKSGLTLMTSILATVFLLNCIVLAILIRKESRLGYPASHTPAAVQSPSPKR